MEIDYLNDEKLEIMYIVILIEDLLLIRSGITDIDKYYCT